MAPRSVHPTAPSSRLMPQLVLAGASPDELRREWQRLYHSDAPRISRDLLILGIGYRLQEIEHGGLGKATFRKLRTLAKTLRTTGRVGPTPSLSLKPGVRLVREWHEIEQNDKTAITKLSGFDAFPDWALPLKLKYLDDERASIEACEVAIQVMKEQVEREQSGSHF